MENKEPMVRCEDCSMLEREAWALQDKHVCGKITDPNYVIMEDMKLKIGKRRWMSIKVK